MILKHKWAKEAIKNTAFIENMNFHLFYLTVKLYAFDSNTYDGSTDGVKGGCRQSCEMSRIWRIYPCKKIGRLG